MTARMRGGQRSRGDLPGPLNNFCARRKKAYLGSPDIMEKRKLIGVLKNAALHQKTPNTWSINADYEVPLTKRLTLKGEWFLGSNLDDFFGGIGQGINTLDRQKHVKTTTHQTSNQWAGGPSLRINTINGNITLARALMIPGTRI